VSSEESEESSSSQTPGSRQGSGTSAEKLKRREVAGVGVAVRRVLENPF